MLQVASTRGSISREAQAKDRARAREEFTAVMIALFCNIYVALTCKNAATHTYMYTHTHTSAPVHRQLHAHTMLYQLQLHASVQLRCPNCACTATEMVLVTPFGSPVMSLLGYLVLATTWFCSCNVPRDHVIIVMYHVIM